MTYLKLLTSLNLNGRTKSQVFTIILKRNSDIVLHLNISDELKAHASL